MTHPPTVEHSEADGASSSSGVLATATLQAAIFNSASFSCIATDAHGVIQLFNVGAERMLGYTALEAVNVFTLAVLHDKNEVVARAAALSVEFGTPIAPGFEALVFRAARGIEDIYEVTKIRKDGSRFPAIVSVTALRDKEDTIIGYLLIETDNTARKLAEDAVVKAGAPICRTSCGPRSTPSSASPRSSKTACWGTSRIASAGASATSSAAASTSSR